MNWIAGKDGPAPLVDYLLLNALRAEYHAAKTGECRAEFAF